MILIAGAGAIGREYALILKAMGLEFSIVCQSLQTAKKMQDEFMVSTYSGGLANHLQHDQHKQQKYQHCIIALPIEILAENCHIAIESGIANVLVEKPVALDRENIGRLCTAAQNYQANVFVAYNRRFFSSVVKLQKMAQFDGGLSSINFEFTEWVDKIQWQHKSKALVDNWLIANSSHVIDLAFHLAGEPKNLSSYSVSGSQTTSLPFVPKSYAGAGITDSGASFSYQANWDGPGRWCIECCSKNYRYVLSPLEKLQIIKRNQVKSEFVDLDDQYDEKFKPGFYHQVDAFLTDKKGLMTLEQQYHRFLVYQEISEPNQKA
jgi:predicted dehydrogenase